MPSGKYFVRLALLLLPLNCNLQVDARDAVDNHEGIPLHSFQDPEAAFNEANLLYLDKKYEEAVSIYEQIIESGYHSAELYYNLGNAYYRSGKIPSAILNYERAALLDPGNEDILFNLDIANMFIRDRIEALPVFFLNRWWKEARNIFSEDGWAVLSIVTFILSLGMAGIFLVSSSVAIKKLLFIMSLAAFMFSLLSFSLGMGQRNYRKNYNAAIVFSPVVTVKSSPDINSTDLFIIHEGTKVRIGESIGEWHSVRLPDGNKGWLHDDAVEKI